MATLHRLACLNLSTDDRREFLAICIGCASVGLLGAVYLITTLYRRYQNEVPGWGWRSGFYLSREQLHIVACLGITDMLACVGIIARSIVWLSVSPNQNGYLPDFENAAYIIVIEGCITCGYLSTFLWSCCYAIDIYSYMTNRSRSLKVYHITTWTSASILTTVAILSLFGFSNSRNIYVSCSRSFESVIYDLTFLLPVVIAMIFLPLVYVLASRHTREFVSGGGVMADVERRSMAVLKFKFFLFVAVFYICWIPTVVNLCYQLSSDTNPRVSGSQTLVTPFSLWIVEAVVNPFQAFFNGLLYSKSSLWKRCLQGPDHSNSKDIEGSNASAVYYSSMPVGGDSMDVSVDNYSGVQWKEGKWKSKYESISTSVEDIPINDSSTRKEHTSYSDLM